MATTSVFCIATTYEQAEQIVARLKNSGFSNTDISALFPNTQGTIDFAHEKNPKGSEEATAGAGAGAVVGGAVGWLAGIGALAIPGIGAFVVAGPIMAMLGGAALGATLGGITGALVGMGIPEDEAERYEGRLKEGNILISVHSKSLAETDRAEAIFREAGAQNIATSREPAVKAPGG